MGSSPLARGAPVHLPLVLRRFRIIPARAGSTRHRTEHGRNIRDHPRSRGKHGRGDPWSPLRVGIIPARAGSTLSVRVFLVMWWDHPRSRGEHFFPCSVHRLLNGSSPLARGAPDRPGAEGITGGIIPARAGSTVEVVQGRRTNRDHPRSRGEHVSGIFASVLALGSSPLARGAHHVSRSGGCGTPGSSPLARGALEARRHRCPVRGIIPARAGSTSPSCPMRTTAGDHPRSRGEHDGRGSSSHPPRGSSPLARGARW